MESIKELLNDTDSTKFSLVEVDLKTIKIGDKVFVEPDLLGVEYTILDIGNPFILVENEITRFAYLHRVNKLYKKIKKLND